MRVEPGAGAREARSGAIRGLRDGLMLVGQGARLLRVERGLWPLAVVPVLLALIFLAGSLTLFVAHAAAIHGEIAGWLPSFEVGAWWTWIWVAPARAIAWVLGWVGLAIAFVATWVAALLLASLVAAPFLDALSQRVETIVLGRPPSASGSVAGLVGETLRSFAAELARLSFLVGIWLVISVVGVVVPGAQIFTGPLLIAVTVLFLPLDHAGFALDRRGVAFAARRRWLVAHWPVMVGFGGVGFLASGVPGLNLLVLPVMVTAGTLLVLRRPPDVDPGRGDAARGDAPPDRRREPTG